MPTSHADLAKSLVALIKRLEKVPETYMVSDPSSLHVLNSSAEALVQQDLRIGEMTSALRDAREALPTEHPARKRITEVFSRK